jgi:TolB-like protein
MRIHILAAMLLIISNTTLAQQAAPPAPAPGEVVIFVAPLRAIGEDGKTAWISQAVQQNVINDLTRLQKVRPVAAPGDATDLETLIKAAKAANATHLFEGSYQLGDPGIRITGQILDLRTNQYVGAAKATGPLRELFALEDSIAEQVKRAVIAQVRIEAKAIPQAPAIADVAIKPDGPVQFPWDRDKPFIAEAKRRAILDSQYEESLYRHTYTYGVSGYYGYGGYYRSWCGQGGVTFFPGGVIRGRAVFFPGGVINVGW